jgi:hypothetical protein
MLNTYTRDSMKTDTYAGGSNRTREFRLTLTMLGRCLYGTKWRQEIAEVLAAYTGVPERGQHVRVIVTFGVQLLTERRPLICPRIRINSPTRRDY